MNLAGLLIRDTDCICKVHLVVDDNQPCMVVPGWVLHTQERILSTVSCNVAVITATTFQRRPLTSLTSACPTPMVGAAGQAAARLHDDSPSPMESTRRWRVHSWSAVVGSVSPWRLVWTRCWRSGAAVRVIEITTLLDQLVPARAVTCRRRPSDPWFDRECRVAICPTRRLERASRQTDPGDVVAATAAN